jgi:bacillithiol biosynthesis deacetylase BshB1
MNPLSILIIAPHPDDAELGMGGTIARLADQGHQVTILDLTDGSPTPSGTRETRLPEAAAAAAALAPKTGLGSLRRVMLDLPNRTVQHTIEARHKVAGVIRAVQANILFMPHPEDAHPDHLASTRIGEDARFDAKLTGITMPTPPGFDSIGPPIYPRWVIYYFCSHLRTVPQPSFIFDISGFEARKRDSILAYRTQFVDNVRNQHVPDWIAAQDRYMGSRINAAAGEAFWTREPLGFASFAFLNG